MSFNDVFKWAVILAPQLLAMNSKTAAIAPDAQRLLTEAEGLQGASGADKLQHVLNMVPAAAHAVTDQTNGAVRLDPAETTAVAAQVIGTAFSIAKTVADAHGAPPPPA